jgi:Domain of unknown function (DUF4157)
VAVRHRPPERRTDDRRVVPPVVEQVLRSPGTPLPAAVLGDAQERFDVDLTQVRVHADGQAAEAARSVEALAFTVGGDIVFDSGRYRPDAEDGRNLLAHELTHVVQQKGATGALQAPAGRTGAELQAEVVGEGSRLGDAVPVPARTVQRVPAPPTFGTATGGLDRAAVAVGEVPEIVATVAPSGVTLTPAAVTVPVAIANPAVTHLSWELYDPSDNMIEGFSTLPRSAQATSRPFPLTGVSFHGTATEGRYILRCTGLADGRPIAYADRSFPVWTRPPATVQGLPELRATTAAPAAHTLGEVGAATARSMMLEHQASIAAKGTGLYQGNQLAGAAPAGVSKEDCTTYVLEVLGKAFAAKGRTADWNAVVAEATRTSGAKFKGTELMRALESKAGWKGVFWAPDPRNPEDSTPEHPSAYRKVQERGTYYGIDVERGASVVDYRRTSPRKQENTGNLDKLRRIPLGVIAARGGTHMTLILNGQVYEVHWDRPATDPNVIEATPLEKWEWQSGAVVVPPGDYAAAFGP